MAQRSAKRMIKMPNGKTVERSEHTLKQAEKQLADKTKKATKQGDE